jgi:hypothetical protein
MNQFWRHGKTENAHPGYLMLVIALIAAGVIFISILIAGVSHFKLSLLLMALIAGVIFSGILIAGVSLSGIKSRVVIQMSNGTAFSWDLERSETNANRINK